VSIEIVEPGMLTSVQDPIGRPAWRHLGVPVGGAADPWSARLANRLIGNADDAALLEMTVAGPTVRFGGPTRVAVTGGLDARLDGIPLAAATARDVRAGALLRVGTGAGARGYLALGGGLTVERVLGSASTDLRTGFGGFEGRALRPGDRLDVGTVSGGAFRWTGSWPAGPIRIVAGPHAELFPADALTDTASRVGPEADRTGVRLDGPALATSAPEAASMGLVLGAIQVPPDGRPIVMLVDRPVTGGYPVPAVVIGADIGRVAQLRPGDELWFASVSIEEARSALRRAENELAALEALGGPPENDELGWAGSHR
jgi:biotin-dependent carboxylase-like uncharacterized protein